MNRLAVTCYGVILSLSVGCLSALAIEEQTIDDQAITTQLSETGGQLIDSNKAVSISELVSELNRTNKKISLAGTRPLVGPGENLYSKVKPGVLVLGGVYKCTTCTHWHSNCAGGFVLTSDGKAVTNYHVINQQGIKSLFAMTSDGDIYPVSEVLAANKQDDVAIVQISLPANKRLKALPIAERIDVGEKVNVLSHPDSHFYTLSQGIVARYALKGGSTWMSVTADYAKGSSGCPVLNDRGQVVGMVANTESIYYTNNQGKQENLQMVVRNCVPSASILKLIR